MRTKAGLVLLAVVALMLAWIPAASAAGTTAHQEDLVVLTGDALVMQGDVVGTVVAFDGAVTVNGDVLGDVVAFHGPVTIDGAAEVGGNLIVLDGTLTVMPGATVSGDIVADQPVISGEATVAGTVRTVDDIAWTFGAGTLAFGFAIWLAIAVSVLLLGLIVLGLAPRALEAAVGAGRTAIGPTIGLGALAFVGLPFVAILAIFTVVGIPLGVGILLALALILATGQVAGVAILGRSILRTGSLVRAFVAGWAIVAAVTLIPFVGGVVWFVAGVYGLGAIGVAVWRARRSPAEAPVPAMPAAPAAA